MGVGRSVLSCVGQIRFQTVKIRFHFLFLPLFLFLMKADGQDFSMQENINNSGACDVIVEVWVNRSGTIPDGLEDGSLDWSGGFTVPAGTTIPYTLVVNPYGGSVTAWLDVITDEGLMPLANLVPGQTPTIYLNEGAGCTNYIYIFGINDNNDGVPPPQLLPGPPLPGLYLPGQLPPPPNLLPPPGQPPLGPLGGGPPPDCITGMPVWSVSEPYISLWLHDEPLGYQPAIGPRVSFELAFKQRESNGVFGPAIFSVGKKWAFSWYSYVAQDYNTNNVVFFAGGGSTTYYTTNDYLTDTTLTGNITNGFTLSYPDGSKDIYNEIVTNSSGYFLEALLSQHFDAQSNKTTLNYYSYSPSVPVARLQNVVDGDGRTNLIYYNTTNPYSTNLISEVVDPFGRTALFSYNTNGDLTNIIDVAMNYDTNDWVTNMTTPYGTTSFTITDSGTTNVAPNGRSVLVTRPDGSHEYYLYEDNAPGITNSFPTNQVPNAP
jgi:hypothetical protein